MSFLQRLKMSLMNFMQGRHGADNLGMFTLLTGLACSLLGSFTGFGILSLLGTGLYFWTIFRMFSKNNDKRIEENRKYIELTSGWKLKSRQFVKRLKNSREYKYFRCPECKLLLRMKRGTGEKEITCNRCKHQFRFKA